MQISKNGQKRIGKYLAAKRVASNLSQAEVAKKLEFDSSQLVSNWERGLCLPPSKRLPTIIRLYNLDRKAVYNLIMSEYEKALKEILLPPPKLKKAN